MAKMNMKAITMAFKEVLLDEEGNPVKDNEGKTAVSYTHLDVYKRQALTDCMIC